KEIPAGSVGIGGQQTGMYPFKSPGGWNLLGRTPVYLYDERRGDDAILYEAGDRIIYKPIDEQRFKDIEKEVEDGTYQVRIEKRKG
ncbi:carboxyltransferase domain-containing protein, partial [Helicobacter pylori]|uniref:carboxyltransferase domain-containing protein n=1 Tax=Helicobacter pylori TaxID=210 RepID=UPI00292802A5